MLIFRNMAGDDAKKLAIVLECLEIDNPRSPKDYAHSGGLRREPDGMGGGRADRLSRKA